MSPSPFWSMPRPPAGSTHRRLVLPIHRQKSQRPEAMAHRVDRHGRDAMRGERRGHPVGRVVFVDGEEVAEDRHRPAVCRRGPGGQEQVQEDLVRPLDLRHARGRADRRDEFTRDLVVGGHVLAEGDRSDGTWHVVETRHWYGDTGEGRIGAVVSGRR